MYQIADEELILEVTEKGAEMKSLRERSSGREYLWCADERYWKRTAPVLFPLVGRYRDNETYYDGKTYRLSQHGFARDMDFSLVRRTETELWFSLEQTEETLEHYPFCFRLTVGYRLEGRTVRVLWRVENTDDREIWFSIGGHPAFVCPPGAEKRSDCRLRFDTDGPLVSGTLNENGVLGERLRTYPLVNREMAVTDDLFDEDALVLESRQASQVSLVDGNGGTYVTVSFDAPVFGIWSPSGDAPFVCVEPWYGVSDREDFNKELRERKCSQSMKPGKLFEGGYTILV